MIPVSNFRKEFEKIAATDEAITRLAKGPIGKSIIKTIGFVSKHPWITIGAVSGVPLAISATNQFMLPLMAKNQYSQLNTNKGQLQTETEQLHLLQQIAQNINKNANPTPPAPSSRLKVEPLA